MYKTLTKPILDHLCALIALLLLSPVFLLVTLALTIANNGKPFFIKARPKRKIVHYDMQKLPIFVH
ncbi:sugar transferase [Planktosalinus lacus]|nr:sugar transferase [Planktosalinus lacus]